MRGNSREKEGLLEGGGGGGGERAMTSPKELEEERE